MSGWRLTLSCLMILLGSGRVAGVEYYLDANSGNDGNTGESSVQAAQTLTKAIALAETQRAVTGSTVIHMAGGNYGDMTWTMPGDFTGTVTWVSSDTADPAVISHLGLAGDSCVANQIFDGIRFHSEPGNSYLAVIQINKKLNVTIRNCEISNEDLYDGAGMRLSACQYVTLHNNYFHDLINAVSFSGMHYAITHNRADRMPGSVFGNFCGGYAPIYPRTAMDVLIAYNVIRHPSGDYPDEPGYENYDEPAELHSSVIAIRGAGYTIDHNIFYNIKETAYIQFYEGDCGVDDYLIGDIAVTNNIFYAFEDALGTFHVPGNGRLDGPAVVENNTIIGQGVGITLEADYDGTGTFVRNNIVYGGFTGALHRQYEDYNADTVKWTVENNIASTRGWQLGHGTLVDPSNIFVDEAIASGDLPADFWDAYVFANPDYSEPNTKFCGPRGTDDCDWSPLTASIVCTSGYGGTYVGAVSCDGTDILRERLIKLIREDVAVQPAVPNPFCNQLQYFSGGEAVLYNADGVLMGKYTGGIVSGTGLEPGVYFLESGGTVQQVVRAR